MRRGVWLVVVLWLVGAAPMWAQQKGQYMPGQYGLNAGVLPDPGFTYANLTLNYDTGTINGANGNGHKLPISVSQWVVENNFMYVFSGKVFGGNYGISVLYPTLANASLDLSQAGINGPTTEGVADLWLQPFNLGWHLQRADIWVADAFMVPTGRYTPGAANNIGTGYFGNHAQTGTTIYLTKNKGTSANLFTDWEVHGPREGTYNTYKTPGQAFTDEWGFGQIVPLKKDESILLQAGVIGYDQWQVTASSGTYAVAGPLGNVVILPASRLPFYSGHGVGGQLSLILPKRNLVFFFKYEDEYKAYSSPIGNTLVFGGAWTLKTPK